MGLKAHLARLLFSGILLAGLCVGPPAWSDETGGAQAVQSFNSGVKAYRDGDFERAVNYLRRTVVLDSGNANARYYLAVSLDKLNQDNEALTQYQYVVEHLHDARLISYAKSRMDSIRPVAQTSPEASMVASASTALASPTPARLMGRFVVPLKSNRNALMVDGIVTNDDARRRTPGTFIIDTGATYTSISREMAEQLGLDLQNCEHVRITTANGRIDVPKVVIDRLSVNGLEARNVEATVIEVRKGSSFQGLLGLSFIRQFVLTIDPVANQLIFQKN